MTDVPQRRVTRTPSPVPVALSVAGSDSGGGAGIQADLQAFRALGVFGTTAITAVTAQNPKGVTDVHPVPAATVTEQIAAVLAEFDVGAIKTGMLFSAELIRAVADTLQTRAAVPLVIDPVMVATSGARLLLQDAIEALRTVLLPRASAVTPNLEEARILVERDLESREDMRAAATELAVRFECLAVVKGGHCESGPATDVVSDGTSQWMLTAPAVDAATTHGTGCSLSAALAAGLAAGHAPLEALVRAKAYVTGALASCRRVGPDAWAMFPPDRLRLEEVTCTLLS